MIKRLWRRWAWAVMLAALWAVLGWERALQVADSLLLIVFALDLYERFCATERAASELRKKVGGE